MSVRPIGVAAKTRNCTVGAGAADATPVPIDTATSAAANRDLRDLGSVDASVSSHPWDSGGWARTTDLRVMSPTRYPAELRRQAPPFYQRGLDPSGNGIQPFVVPVGHTAEI